jgi:CHAT domain-containing protein
VCLTGESATEKAFKEGAPGRAVLHLATHGFFLAGRCGPAAGAEEASLPAATSPLLLSGLALSGANERDAAGSEGEDGILTAEEIAALRLAGVSWAVLSGCDTGVGEVTAGEGVLGLRRAFHVAGAGAVIMSLWPVSDEATRQWMRALYESRLGRGLATAEAVHEANLSVLRDRREKGRSTHPFYWAGFVAEGDWR